MRLTCMIAALLLSTNLLLAADATSSASASGLSEKEIKEGFVSLFDGKTLRGWQGAIKGYAVEDGVLVCKKHGGGNLLTDKQYADFTFRVEYKLAPGGNNGVGIRTPAKGNPAYLGMEIQILDDSSPKYKNLKPVQYNGSIYGVMPAKRGHLKPVGQWNSMEIMAKGSKIKVTLNGVVITEADVAKLGPKSIHGHEITGLHSRKGHIAFCGHGHRLEFRNIRIKELK